jgi:hypothetical protein
LLGFSASANKYFRRVHQYFSFGDRLIINIKIDFDSFPAGNEAAISLLGQKIHKNM